MNKYIITLATSFTLLSSIGLTTLNASQSQVTKKFSKPSKPFLIKGKLPHLTMMVKKMWNDNDLALTSQQKKQLLIVRKETVIGAKSLNKKIIPLEKEIVESSFKGLNPKFLEDKVKELAQLRAKATIIHLNCIYNTRKILTKKQLNIIE